MKKRVLHVVAALALCLALLPSAAAAEPIPTGRVYVYNGERQNPTWELRVTHPDGTNILLVEGVNFSVTYEHSNGNGNDLTNVGTVIANLVGITVGFNYFYSFEIAPAPLTITGLGGSHTKEYDGGTDCDGTGLEIQFDGRFHDDDVTIKPQGGTYTYSDPNAGTGKGITLDGASYVLEGTAAGNYYIAGDPPSTLTIFAGTIDKGTYTGMTTIGTSGMYGKTKTYDLSNLLPEDYALGEITTSDVSGIFAGAPTRNGTVLTYQLVNDESKVGEQGSIRVPVTAANYDEFELTIMVTVTDVQIPTLVINPISATYTGSPVNSNQITGTATVEGREIAGTWSFAEGQDITNVADSGTKTVKFTPTDQDNYAEATGTIVVTIHKATPAGAPKYTAISTGGKTLADAALTAPAGWPAGALAWVLPEDTEVTANAQYEWTFTPNDTANYNTVTGKLTPWKRSTGGGGGGYMLPSLPVTTTGQGDAAATTTTAVPTASTQGGAASATVDTAMGQEIVKQAMENNSEAVIIAPKINGSVTKAEVSIPASTVGRIGSQTGASLTVSTPVAEVTIPNGGLGSLGSAGGTVTVTAEQTGNTVELTVTAGNKTVERVPGGVTLTVPAEHTTPGTVAVLVHPDGTREVVRKSVADGDSVTIPLDGSAKLELVDNSKPFADVPDTGWQAEAVAFVSGHELLNSTAPGQFGPEAPMSRGMLAVVLHNLESNPPQAFTGVFADVDSGQWYAEGVAWAEAQGIIRGYETGTFGPNDNITREQLVVMLWRYAGSPAATERELRFADAYKASDWAEEALRWAVENGVINGKGGGVLDPGGYATRAAAAQMLKNFMEK